MPIISTELGAYLDALEIGDNFDAETHYVYYFDPVAGKLKKTLLPPPPEAGSGIIAVSDQTVGVGGVSSITVSSIPSSTGVLDIRFYARASTTGIDLSYAINADTTNSHYYWTFLDFNASGSNTAGAADRLIGEIASSAHASGVYTLNWLRFPEYAGNQKKSILNQGVSQQISTGYSFFQNGSWNQTAAIASVTFYPQSGVFVEGCRLIATITNV